MKLRYTPAAMMDLEEIKSYIADTLLNPDAAASLMAGIAEVCAPLKDQPLPGPELRPKLHREIDERFLIHEKYMIVYEVTEAVSILRVLDTRTDYLNILLHELQD